jgi:glutaconyl-CoA/methylmalonyl-CoA decarboxylase subunit gamma
VRSRHRVDVDNTVRLVDVTAGPDGVFVVAVEGEADGFDVRCSTDGTVSWTEGSRRVSMRVESTGTAARFSVHDVRHPGTGPWVAQVQDARLAALAEAAGKVRRVKAGPFQVTVPMPGKVIRILVKAGDVVTATQPIAVIEAMKMENEVSAARAGTVSRIAIAAGDTVEAGTLLAVVE